MDRAQALSQRIEQLSAGASGPQTNAGAATPPPTAQQAGFPPPPVQWAVTNQPAAFIAEPLPTQPTVGGCPADTRLQLLGQQYGPYTAVLVGGRRLWVPTATIHPMGPGPRPPATPTPRTTKPANDVVGWSARAVAIIGGVVTVFGIGFLLVLAAQNGYLSPEVRTIGATILGSALLAAGFFVRLRDRDNIGAPILVATGMGGLFLSTISATVIYGWLPPMLGVAIAAAIGLAGQWIGAQWRTEALAAASLATAPVVAAWMGASIPDLTMALLVAMSGAALFIPYNSWNWTPYVAILPTAGVFAALTSGWLGDIGDSATTLGWISVAFVAVGTAFVLTRKAIPLTDGVVVVVATTLPALLCWWQAPNRVGGLVLIAIAVTFTTLSAVPQPSIAQQKLLHAAFIPTAGVMALSGAEVLVGGSRSPLPFLTIGGAYLCLAYWQRSLPALGIGGVIAAIGILASVPAAQALFSPDPPVPASLELVLCGLAIAGIGVAALLLDTRFRERSTVGFYIGVTLTLAGGSTGIMQLTVLADATLNGDVLYQIVQALVTVVVTAFGLWLLVQAIRPGNRLAYAYLRMGMVVIAGCVIKLLLVDTSQLNSMIRVALVIAIGILLLLMGARFAKAWDRAKQGQWPVPPGPPTAAATPVGPQPPATAPGFAAGSAPAPPSQGHWQQPPAPPATFDPRRPGNPM